MKIRRKESTTKSHLESTNAASALTACACEPLNENIICKTNQKKEKFLTDDVCQCPKFRCSWEICPEVKRVECKYKPQEAINQSINPSIHQSIIQSISQSINLSFNQSINQSIIQSINHSISWLIRIQSHLWFAGTLSRLKNISWESWQ